MLEVNFKDSRGDWSATLPLTQHIGFSEEFNLLSFAAYLLQVFSIHINTRYTHVFER